MPKYWQKRIFPWPPLVFADYKFLVKREKSTNLRKAVTKQTNRQTDCATPRSKNSYFWNNSKGFTWVLLTSYFQINALLPLAIPLGPVAYSAGPRARLIWGPFANDAFAPAVTIWEVLKVKKTFWYKQWFYEKRRIFNSDCAKSVHIQSYSVPHFPIFGLNTERYRISLRIQYECGKIRSRITPNTANFQALTIFTLYLFI